MMRHHVGFTVPKAQEKIKPSLYHLYIPLALILLIMTPCSGAPTYGAEWEFSSTEMLRSGGLLEPGEVEQQAACWFVEAVRKKHPDYTFQDIPFCWGSHVQVTLPDGFYFIVSYDPSCIEINTKPATLEELRLLKDQLNESVFATARDLGLTISWWSNAGHMNFGALSMFGDDPELFMRFMVDYANHPCLAAGAWGDKCVGGPPLNWLTQRQRDAFATIVEETRRHAFEHLKEVATQICSRVYTHSIRPTHEPQHYQAIGLKYLTSENFPARDAPCEIRNMFPQFSMEDFIRNAEILERRVQFLKEQNTPLLYLGIRQKMFRPQETVDHYYLYLSEMGLDWNHYKTTMHPALQAITPSALVLRSPQSAS